MFQSDPLRQSGIYRQQNYRISHPINKVSLLNPMIWNKFFISFLFFPNKDFITSSHSCFSQLNFSDFSAFLKLSRVPPSPFHFVISLLFQLSSFRIFLFICFHLSQWEAGKHSVLLMKEKCLLTPPVLFWIKIKGDSQDSHRNYTTRHS